MNCFFPNGTTLPTRLRFVKTKPRDELRFFAYSITYAYFPLDTEWIWFFNSSKVNLIKRLFSRRQQSESESSPYLNWSGQSGKEYQYEIFPLDASFQPLPGNYIYAMQAEDGTWVPVYIAQTRDLHQRLEGHVRLSDAVEHGATHLHAHYASAGQAARCSEERDLILRWQPVCNELLET